MTISELLKACVNILDVNMIEVELSYFDYKEYKVKFEKHIFYTDRNLVKDNAYIMIKDLYGDKIVSFFHIRGDKTMLISAKKGEI